MRYQRSVVAGTVVLACVVACSIIVYYFSKDSCPAGTFACSLSEGSCFPQRSVCDNHNDCLNGEDEDSALCSDINGSINMILQTVNWSISEAEYYQRVNRCDIEVYPPECDCKHISRIYCKNVGLTDVPQTITSNVSHLILANNSIATLTTGAFSDYDLEVIHLEGNQLTTLPSGVFQEQTNLKRLFLMYNHLSVIEKGAFVGARNLLWLFLNNNRLEGLDLIAFANLYSLVWLDLSNNKLHLTDAVFPPLPKLLEIMIDHNTIESITDKTFGRLVKLELLGLRKNRISSIDKDAFLQLGNLHELDLYGNALLHLHTDLFRNMSKLEKLYLGRNPFHRIPAELFQNMGNLASLNLEGIEIENIDLEIFSKLVRLESIYFKKYRYCNYVPDVMRCRPLSDGISSMSRLLNKPMLRYTAWATCAITCLGNLLVICGRLYFKDENKVLSLVIRNLAASDLLMGVYLLIITLQDIKFKDVYVQEAQSWISSWLCTFAGTLAMVSSEVSVLLLVFMSLERFFLIALPFGRFSSIIVPKAVISLFSIWIIGVGLSIIPIIQFHSSTRFYGTNGLCFPLHIDDPYFVGWEYTLVVVFGINATSLIIVAAVYVAMFVSIWKTRRATSMPIKDFELAIRFFFIVLADASCWFPIIFVKVLALYGTEISGDIYAFLVVFVLPINSAVNPLLYTFTTPKYRKQINKVNIGLGCWEERNVPYLMNFTRRQSPQSNADSSNNTNASRNAAVSTKPQQCHNKNV